MLYKKHYVCCKHSSHITNKSIHGDITPEKVSSKFNSAFAFKYLGLEGASGEVDDIGLSPLRSDALSTIMASLYC